MAARDSKPGPASLADWKRYVQRETRRLLQKQQEERTASGESGDGFIDAATGLPIPPEARHVHDHPELESPDVSHRLGPMVDGHASGQMIPTFRTPTPRMVREEILEPELADLDLDDLAIALDSDVRPLTPQELAALEAERIAAYQVPGPAASSPLEAEEAALGLDQSVRAGTEAERSVDYLLKSENRDALEVKTAHAQLPEADLALQQTAVDLVREIRPAEQVSLFDTAHLERRSEEARLAQKPSPKQKREDLIEDLLDPVISLEQAATILNVCKTTVRRYTNQGLLECIRTPGNQRRFRLSTILSFVEDKDAKGIGKRGRKPGKSKSE